MNFKIKNFGKIAEANIKLDGITVICGNNNTGKSTVGKALFSFFNSLFDYKNKITLQKSIKFSEFISNNGHSFEDIFSTKDHIGFITNHEGIFTVDEVKKYIESNTSVKATKEKVAPLTAYLNTSEREIINEYVYRYFNKVMNGQIKNSCVSGSSRCIITGEFKDSQSKISISKNYCSCSIEKPIEHTAYYINSPFALDWLNIGGNILYGMNILEKNVISAIRKAHADMNEDSMANILDSVINKKDLDKIRSVLKKAYIGDTTYSDGKYFYREGDNDYDFRNISAGLKSFALIERMLETGVLKKKDVLILDEPEIHLHSEWQIIYAELIVILQKTFDLTILLVTHSFQFLESLDFFMKNHEISHKGNYYIPESNEKGFVMKSYGNDATELKKALTTGSVTLSNLKFKYEMENYREEDN